MTFEVSKNLEGPSRYAASPEAAVDLSSVRRHRTQYRYPASTEAG